MKDLTEAGKLCPDERDIARLMALTSEDMEIEKRLEGIKASGSALEGRQYVDYVLDFYQGKNSEDTIA